jgi:ABC-type glutathione transport system ATPase component
MIAMLICDIVLYVLIAWYIDNVKTSRSKNRGCFCFRRSYWGSQRSASTNEENLEDYVPTEGDFEHVDELGNPVVKVKRIRKTFDINGKTFVAVDGFKLDLYEDQIVSLLGNTNHFP